MDIITKRPLNEQRIAGEISYGLFNDKFSVFDYSQPINDDLALRFVVSSQDAESFRDFTTINRDAIAFSSRYYLMDATRIDVRYEWRDKARPVDRGTLAEETLDGSVIINDLLDVPFSQRFGSPWEIGEINYQILELGAQHTFNDVWDIEFNIAKENSRANDLQSRARSVKAIHLIG